MDIGELIHRITLEEPTLIVSDARQAKYTYYTMGDVWALVETTQSNETFGNQKTKNTYTYKTTIRYRNDLTEKHRVIWDSKTLNILTITPDVDKTLLTITAAEVK